MTQLIRVLLSPMAFAVGFLWPLATQSMLAMGLDIAFWPAVAAGGVIALGFGAMAQIRGSWLWIK